MRGENLKLILQLVTIILPPAVKRPEVEDGLSTPVSSKVKNGCIYTSASSYESTARTVPSSAHAAKSLMLHSVGW